MEEGIKKWIQTCTDEEIRNRIDQTLPGIDGGFGNLPFAFTKWQRLMMSTWSELPIDASVSLRVIKHDTSNTNKSREVASTWSRFKGSCPTIQILDVPTAGGKTACSLAMATLLLSPSRFQNVVKQMMQRCFVDYFRGYARCELPECASSPPPETPSATFYRR